MKPNRSSSLLNPLTFSIAALGLIVLFLIIMTPSLYRSGQTFFITAPEPDDALDKLLARHEQNTQTDVDRFNGRSFFYTPPIQRKPPPPPPPPPPRPVEEEKPPPPPPEPTFPPNYTGPTLVAIFGSEAWFKEKASDGDPLTRLNIGDSHGDIDVLATDPPRGITVKYRGGGPYEIALIDMDATPFSDQPVSLEVPSGILEDVDPDEATEDERPIEEQCERDWRISIARLSFTNEYEPEVAIRKRIEIYQGWINWWDRTPDTMRTLGAPSVDLVKAMIAELESELQQHVTEDEHQHGTEPPEMEEDLDTPFTDPEAEDRGESAESTPEDDSEPKSSDSDPSDTDKEEGS